MIAAYFKCNGHQVFISELIEDFGIVSQQNTLICNSRTAYAICFMHGLTKDAIEDAATIAKRIVMDRINNAVNQAK